MQAKLSETEIYAQLFDAEGAILESFSIRNEAASIGEIGILVANNTNKAVAFKNLRIETLNQPLQPIDRNTSPTINAETFVPYANWAIVAISALTAIIYAWKKEKTRKLMLQI
jgi:hypothetical protein